jgi:hypothetical protein
MSPANSFSRRKVPVGVRWRSPRRAPKAAGHRRPACGVRNAGPATPRQPNPLPLPLTSSILQHRLDKPARGVLDRIDPSIETRFSRWRRPQLSGYPVAGGVASPALQRSTPSGRATRRRRQPICNPYRDGTVCYSPICFRGGT